MKQQIKYEVNNRWVTHQHVVQAARRSPGFFTRLGLLVWIIVALWVFLPRIANAGSPGYDNAYYVKQCSKIDGVCRPVMVTQGLMIYSNLNECLAKAATYNDPSTFCDVFTPIAGGPTITMPGPPLPTYNMPTETTCVRIGITVQCRTR